MTTFSFSKQGIPPALALLQSLAYVLGQCETLFASVHPWKDRMSAWRGVGILEEVLSFSEDRIAACLVQATLLGALSMHQGILVPDLKGVSVREQFVTLYWQNGIASKFSFGVIDTAFYEAKRDMCKKLFPNRFRHKSGIEISLLIACAQRIQSYHTMLPEVAACLRAIQSPATLQIWLSRTVAKEQLFVFLSCLPVAQLNLLFMTVGNSLPDEVPLKIQQRQTLNVSAVFRQPSQDVAFLIEKIMCYMDLYYAVDWPILQHITQRVTQNFVKEEALAKPAIFEEICHNARHILEMQVDTREQTYKALLWVLRPLLQ